MGLYSQDITPEKLFKVGKLIAIFVAAIVILYFLLLFLQPKAINVSLSKNPLVLGKDDFVVLDIKITNITGKDASNVLLEVKAIDNESIKVNNKKQEISNVSFLGKDESRYFSFKISPANGSILPGTYAIVISLKINDKQFSEKIFLEVKKP